MTSYQRHKQTILNTACYAIDIGIKHHQRYSPSTEGVHRALLEHGASFVTLEINAQLRGCIGSLEPRRTLLSDIASNAYAAAFNDPRFSPLTGAELASLQVTVSVLSEAVKLDCVDEQDCLEKLQPGVDGLIISDHNQRATFLPSVWSSLPEPRDFLLELKRKAGFAADYWSDSIQISRYSTEHISAAYPEIIHED